MLLIFSNLAFDFERQIKETIYQLTDIIFFGLLKAQAVQIKIHLDPQLNVVPHKPTHPADSHANLFHIYPISNQTFGGNFRLLESQFEVKGHYEHPYAGDLHGTAVVSMVLPSGQTYSSDLALNHTYDGVTRDLMVIISFVFVDV